MCKRLWISGLATALMCAAAVRADEPAERFPLLIDRVLGVEDGTPKVSQYWLGLACAPVGQTLRAQLGLPKDQGLVIQRVMPDSPAAKAGIRQHDVLVKVGDTAATKLEDLVEAVEAAKETELVLQIVRGGKPKKITVTPAKRPDEARAMATDRAAERLPEPSKWDADAIRKLIEQARPGERFRSPLRYRFFRPGMILPPGAEAPPAIPGNMTIVITKQGDKPARIVVKQDAKQWEATEGELDELPEVVRGHVERMLSPPAGVLGLDWAAAPARPERTLRPVVPLERRLQRRLDEMSDRIEQLHKSVEQLRQRVTRPKDADEKPKK